MFCFWQAFPLGSPLVSDISRRILNLTEGETLRAIENKWLLGEKQCLESTTPDSPIQLDHHSFQVLFLIVFVASLLLLLLMFASKRYQRRQRNPPSDGLESQANAPNDQYHNVAQEEDNVGDGDEADTNEHHILEVKPLLVQLQNQPLTESSEGAVRPRRQKKLASKTIEPLRTVAQPSRTKSV